MLEAGKPATKLFPMQMTDDSGTEQGDNRRNGEKWLDSECILKEDSTKEC